MTSTQHKGSDRLSYEEKKELPDSVFGLPERREYPMPDAAHVRAAEAYFRYCPEDLRPRLARAISCTRQGIWRGCGEPYGAGLCLPLLSPAPI